MLERVLVLVRVNEKKYDVLEYGLEGFERVLLTCRARLRVLLFVVDEFVEVLLESTCEQRLKYAESTYIHLDGDHARHDVW